MKRLESREDYLEAILQLSKNGGVVHAVDVAHELSFSKPSVSVAMAKLKDAGLIEISHKGQITLTPEGHEIASKTLEKHQLLASFFISLGVDKTTAFEDACRVEHDLSDETWKALKNHIQK